MSSQLDVILPQKTHGEIGIASAAKKEKYPVLYLLHGMTDNQSTWQRNTSIERYAAEKGDRCGNALLSSGMVYGHEIRIPVFHLYLSGSARRLPKFFPCISDLREDNFVAGNSMGGYGALKLALSRPDRFCAAASLSGGVDASSCASRNQDSFIPHSGKTSLVPRKRSRAAKTIFMPWQNL